MRFVFSAIESLEKLKKKKSDLFRFRGSYYVTGILTQGVFDATFRRAHGNFSYAELQFKRHGMPAAISVRFLSRFKHDVVAISNHRA